MKNYWIFKTINYCPLCGKEEIYRERKYNKKPKDYNKRNETKEGYLLGQPLHLQSEETIKFLDDNL